MLPPKDYLRQQRLQYVKRALEHAPDALFALLQAEASLQDSFYRMLQNDMQWLRKNTPSRVSFADCSDACDHVTRQIGSFELKAWHKLVKQAVCIAKERHAQRADLEDFRTAYFTEAHAAGLHIYISTSLAKAETLYKSSNYISSEYMALSIPCDATSLMICAYVA